VAPLGIDTQNRCNAEGCGEAAVASVDHRTLCYQHFLTYSYQALEVISAQIHDPQFHNRQAEGTGRFLEECMRNAADVACVVTAPTNLERARVMDVLLWASELHGLLRRGPRVPARMAVLLRSEASDAPWEENGETQLVSRHGAQILCRREPAIGDRLTCVRLDSGARVEAQVVWARHQGNGNIEIGIEFLSDTNFWNFRSGNPSPSPIPAATPATTVEQS
jgi:hypothetical protein